MSKYNSVLMMIAHVSVVFLLQYYYSIKDISIGGRCVCNGHAEACNAEDPTDPYKYDSQSVNGVRLS